ncbi:XRE family transcriptional regulator [Eubacterium sp. 1001713B170207_170306_E7]|uniref:XRE family transcriptional regulator n=1 Tax=Eubacterium sp. 1001713B170207_170306_E7 TaxID=2787097 RepID=UPI0018997051|nr:XRE family transcriptional regulator [Eubacterium sp. 1001713B170207_170306_E7]
MIKKPTDALLNALMASNTLENYFQSNKDYLIDCTLPEHLNALLEVKKQTKAAVIKNAELNEIYGYQIFSGKRKPSRDKLIMLCIGMKLTLEEIQQVLKLAGHAFLYPKKHRDCILIFGLKHGLSIYEINEILYDRKEETLN